MSKNTKYIEFIESSGWHKLGNWKSTIMVNELATVGLRREYLKSIGFDHDIDKVLAVNDDYYISEDDYQRLWQHFSSSIEADTGYLESLAKKINDISARVLDEMQGVQTLESFFEIIKRVMSVGVAIVPLDSAIESYLSARKMHKDLSNYVYPISRASMIRERISLLEIKQAQGTGKDINNDLVRHANEFGWMNTVNWRLPLFDADYYTRILESISLDDASKELNLLKSDENEIKIKNFTSNLSKEEQGVLNSLRLLLDAKMLNWDVVGMANLTFRRLIAKETAKLTYDQAIYLTSSEIVLVRSGELDMNKVENFYKERVNGKILIYSDHRITIYPPDDMVRSIVEKSNNSETTSSIKGVTAYKGVVTGRVKIIQSPAEAPEMPEGDILVCPMTNPDFMPAVIKSIAIVTDEGGILCHAAIVSRELKKPCVIGAKIATKLLKTGDMVEVDADNGIVRIIK